jgi:hypothetical protein
LSKGDPNIDAEDGHPIAYAQLLQVSQSYERPPLFLREDSEQIVKDPEMAQKVPVWMNTAAQVATGNRRMVLEDGPDKMNSDEDDALEDEHGEELTGVYTPEKIVCALTSISEGERQPLIQRLRPKPYPPNPPNERVPR